jgi:hypothetical protein
MNATKIQSQQITHEPTPAEIAAMCSIIRQDWSEEEHRSRAGVSREIAWLPPGVERYHRAVGENPF